MKKFIIKRLIKWGFVNGNPEISDDIQKEIKALRSEIKAYREEFNTFTKQFDINQMRKDINTLRADRAELAKSMNMQINSIVEKSYKPFLNSDKENRQELRNMRQTLIQWSSRVKDLDRSERRIDSLNSKLNGDSSKMNKKIEEFDARLKANEEKVDKFDETYNQMINRTRNAGKMISQQWSN